MNPFNTTRVSRAISTTGRVLKESQPELFREASQRLNQATRDLEIEQRSLEQIKTELRTLSEEKLADEINPDLPWFRRVS